MRAFICFVLLWCTFFVKGQNLVLNPSFELGAVCDGTTERIDSIQDWWPVRGRPSFINTQCPLSKDSKSFIIGMKLPSASYGDVYSVQKFDKNTECQQGRLKTPLEAGKQYIVSMYVRLPIQFCQLPMKEVGVAFTEEPISAAKERGVIDFATVALRNNTETDIKNQYDWQEIFALYTAKGGEEYLAIGNFKENNKGVFDNRSERECTYLFMDGVSVRLFEEIELPLYKADKVTKNTRFRLSASAFEEKSAALPNNLVDDLVVLAQQLNNTPDLKAELIVYTNNSLPPAESLSLSEARARSIQQYLLEQKVSPKQLVIVGQGSKNPIVLNSNPKAAVKNDRVEVVFVNL
jgi:outer membrane protein OmpA-like peptidoglycan-associated protein